MSTESPSRIFDPALHSLLEQLLQQGSVDIYYTVIAEAERRIIQQVLEFTDGNFSQASRRLGISPFTLRVKLRAHAKMNLDRVGVAAVSTT